METMILTYIGLILKQAEVTFTFKGLETKLERPWMRLIHDGNEKDKRTSNT